MTQPDSHVDDAAYAQDVSEDEQLDNMSEPPVHHDVPRDQGDAGPAGVKNS